MKCKDKDEYQHCKGKKERLAVLPRDLKTSLPSSPSLDSLAAWKRAGVEVGGERGGQGRGLRVRGRGEKVHKMRDGFGGEVWEDGAEMRGAVDNAEGWIRGDGLDVREQQMDREGDRGFCLEDVGVRSQRMR